MKNKLVFIGNSIVNGFPMSRGRSFPGLVRAAIKAGETTFHADVINKGANGETTADILRRFEHDVLEHEPRAVFIMTGTNDFIYREAGPSQCMENLRQMADMGRAEGTGGNDEAGAGPGIIPVFMTPIAVDAEKAGRMWMAGLGIDYEGINRQIGEFSDLIRQSGELFIDTGAAWQKFTGDCGQEGTGQPLGGGSYLDGVHPTPEGYEFLADTVLTWLEEHAQQIGLK